MPARARGSRMPLTVRGRRGGASNSDPMKTIRPLPPLSAAALAALLLLSLTPAASGRAGAARAAAAGEGTRHFSPPVALDSFAPIRTLNGESSGEPTIDVDRSGSIFVAGTYGVGGASPVWRSEDGVTFSELETPGHVREYLIGAEGDVAVDDAGNVYFADTFLAGVMLTKWSDGGDTWEFTRPIAPGGPGVFDRPWLTWTEKGLFLYVNFGSTIDVFRSTDDGQTWTAVGPLTWRGSADGQPYFPGHMSADAGTGALVVAGMIRDYERGETFLAATYSPDAGETWREAVVASWPQRPGGGISPIFPGMTAMDGAGTAYVTWSEYDFRGCDVYYSYSSDAGRSWSDPIRLSRRPGCATFPTLDASDRGDLAAAWYETPTTQDNTPGRRTTVPSDYASRYGGFALPLLSYQDDVDGDAEWFVETAAVERADTRRPLVTRARATRDPILTGALERRLIDFFEVALGRDGRLHVAFGEDVDGDAAPRSWYVGSRKSLFGDRRKR